MLCLTLQVHPITQRLKDALALVEVRTRVFDLWAAPPAFLPRILCPLRLAEDTG
jgi:hypothetical protein